MLNKLNIAIRRLNPTVMSESSGKYIWPERKIYFEMDFAFITRTRVESFSMLVTSPLQLVK